MFGLPEFLWIIAGVVCGLAVLAVLSIYAYGRFARRVMGAPSCALPVHDCATQLDRRIAVLADREGGLGVTRDALSLIVSNIEAFAARVLAVRMAERSLDMMYYIWDDDVTGRLLLNEVLNAAERGVRVRLLLDDINAQGRDPAYVALDQHPNIEIRMFNPSRTRKSGLRRGLEMLLRIVAVTRRMHNKAFIVDGRLAFVGGRNVADAYFGAGEVSNFRDLDLLLIGPSVRDVEGIFDNFWNSIVALPIHALTLPASLQRKPEKWREKLNRFPETAAAKPYRDFIHQHIGLEYFLQIGQRLFAAEKIRVLSDPPEKALGHKAENWLMAAFTPLMKQARRSLQVTSPYFVPGHGGTSQLVQLAEQGCDVQVLTNSLAATDVAAVHGGYAPSRKKLLAGGVKLYELKSDGGAHRLSLFGSGRASLHTKAFLIDGKIGFVGSFNFDPRSASLNTEMGILFECPEILAKMERLFCEEINGDLSYHVTLDEKGRLRWSYIKDKKARSSAREPESPLWRRGYAKLVGWLPIRSQL